MPPTPDRFGTATLRRAVLDAWTASPARFREDANAEEDLVRGGYRGRWFTELAQNAADAGAVVGTPARLRVALVGNELRVANSGAPLDADGVAALASLRASAKRDGTATGRFGVGFAAVVDLSDAPRVVTRGADGALAGIAFDRARSFAAVTAAAGPLADEARRRGPDGVPVLRLVWPDPDLDSDPGAGMTTEVRLPLRAPRDHLVDEARAAAPELLLALPWLGAVEVGGRALTRVEHADGRLVVADREWTTVPLHGDLPAAVLREDDGRAALAVEDRARSTWSGLWAWPDDGVTGQEFLHAPTATAEATSLPARLVLTVPLDADRRRVRRGQVTDHVLRAAAAAYPDLVRRVAPGTRTALVPAPGLPASAVDAVLRDGVHAALREAAWLPGADGTDVAPTRALALADDAPELREAVADAVGGLIVPPWTAALGDLGVARIDLGGLLDRLAGLRRDPAWWRRLYTALAALEGRDAAELEALPVPLADGRLVLSARGTVLPGPALADLDPAELGPAGVALRLVHPQAAHPLLETLGARRADGAALLDEPEVREAVDRSLDDAEAGLDVEPLVRLVLTLVSPATAGARLGALALPDDDGGYRRADELVLPDGALRGVLAPDSPLGVLAPRVLVAHGREALLAAGVLDGFAVLVDEDPTGPDHDLDDEESWWADEVDPDPGRVADPDPPGPPGTLTAVRDLDLVADWDAAWAVLAADRAVRAALVRLPGEPTPYTGWWLARHGRLAGHRPGHWRLPGPGGEWADLYDPVPVDLDTGFLTAVGVRTGLRVADAADAADLLARLGDPRRDVDAGTAAAAYGELAEAIALRRVDVADVDPPTRVRTVRGAVVDADPDRDPAPVVLDRPWLLAAFDPDVVVPVAPHHAAALAELLDLPCASDRVHGEVRSPGVARVWRTLDDAAVWATATGRELPDGQVVVHERLRVAVTVDGATREIFPGVWTDDGVLHTDDPVRALLAATN